MLALMVVANPSDQSFSHAMAAVAEQVLNEHGFSVAFHDLYEERFDPVQPLPESENRRSTEPLIETHCDELANADLILIFHPNWWGQPPAILKGWIDRVFRPDTAYRYPSAVGYDGVPQGLLRARCALIFNTSNTPPERESDVFGDPLEILWKRCVFGLCGVKNVKRRMYGPISGSTDEQRAEWLGEVASIVQNAAA